MIKYKKTENLGYRGLMEQFLRSQDYHHAFIYGEKLFNNNPYIEKIYDTLVNIVVKTNNWQQLIIIPAGNSAVSFLNDVGSEVLIQVMGNTDYIPVKTIKLKNAFPTTLSAIELSNTAENQTLRCSIQLSYEDWEEVGTLDGFSDLAGRATDLISNSVNLVRNIGKSF